MKKLKRQLVVRVDDELSALLDADAERYGRTASQSVRFYLKKALEDL